MSNALERNWIQVSCQRDVKGANFERGVQDFNFSVGGRYSWVPSKSYFRITMKLQQSDMAPGAPGATLGNHVAGDPFTFADDVCANLFNNCYFRAGGADVSSIVTGAAQAHMVKQRLSRSGAWLDKVGTSAYGLQVTTEADVAANPGQGRKAGSVKHNEQHFIWQPPIGIFDEEKPLGAGDYKLQLNPNSNYKRACVEADTNTTRTYDVTVEDMQFFACIEKNDMASTGTERLYLTEMQVQSKAHSETLDFTVPPSTKAITIFAQSNTAGSDNRFPLTKFKTGNVGADNHPEEKLEHIQVTYANVNKPSTNWSSGYNPTAGEANLLGQRWLDSQVASGCLESEGGCESFDDWLTRGPILHFDFNRDAEDRSTHLQLQTKYAGVNALPNTNIYVVSHYTRVAEVTRTNGLISNVSTLSV